METKRNIQKNSSLSILDMKMEQFTVALSKKCDRLATALYLITNFLSDTEPLKFRLRSLSLELVRGATLVRYGTIENESTILGTVSGNITETLGLFELAFINGLISEMNFSILKREYVSLSDAIQIRKTSRTSRTDTVFEELFFGPSILKQDDLNIHHGVKKESLSEPNKTDSLHEDITSYSQGQTKGHFAIKDTQSFSKMSYMSTENLKSKTIGNKKDYDVSLGKSEKKIEHPNRNIQNIPISIQSRRVRIIKLVKDKKEVSLKDISDHFPELSEKTIQRELVSLTESGVFKRTGLRRWSRYSVA